MKNSLIQYLVKYGHLVLPGIGTLHWQKKEAYWEAEQLIAPKELVTFDPMDDKPNKFFYTFLGEQMGVNEDQAKIQFENFINQFTNQTIATFPLGNIGRLRKNANHYTWDAEFNGSLYYNNLAPLAVEQAPVESVKSQNNNDKQWIIWTILLIIVSISLIIYKQF